MLQIDILRELTIETIGLRVLLSLVVGGMLGLERESKNQPAGFRTYMLVCLGATVVMMTNQYIVTIYATGDPSRLGAQVISGIGFLGAGTIIVTKRSQVRGLTTAAGLWAAACIGLAIGIGFYEGAVIVGTAILLIMTIFQKIEYFFKERSTYMRLYTNFVSVESMNHFIELSNANAIKILNMQISKIQEGKEKEIIAIFYIKIKKKKSHFEILQLLTSIEGLKFIEEI